MKTVSSTLVRLSAVLLGVAAAATSASAEVSSLRNGAPRGYDQRKPPDTQGIKARLASNCTPVSFDRTVGAQRVWSQHGVISVGGHVEKTTECR